MSSPAFASAAESGSTLPPGSEHPWPSADLLQQDLCLLEGEVALIGVWRDPTGLLLERRTHACLTAPCRLPRLPQLPVGVELRLKVVLPARLAPSPEGVSPSEAIHSPALAADLDAWLQSLSPMPTSALPPTSPALAAAAPAQPDPLTTLARWLAERHGTTVVPLLDPPADPLEHLRALLDRAGLIAFPLQLEPADLRRDCGDLILLLERGPLLLLSEPDGYRWRDPAAPPRAPRCLPPQSLLSSRGTGVGV